MKTLAALTIALAAIASAPAAQATPRQTEPALACLLGMGKEHCETQFVGAAFNQPFDRNTRPLGTLESRRAISYCAEEFVHKFLDNCPRGPLETVHYMGANVRGYDVYDVKFMHGDNTYVVAPPTPDGKTPAFWRFAGTPDFMPTWRDIVDITAPATPPRIIYSRHE